jgi:hypothetical protein
LAELGGDLEAQCRTLLVLGTDLLEVLTGPPSQQGLERVTDLLGQREALIHRTAPAPSDGEHGAAVLAHVPELVRQQAALEQHLARWVEAVGEQARRAQHTALVLNEFRRVVRPKGRSRFLNVHG